jgi:hypothetical protein
MSDRSESSVMFALGELRDIEHDRVRRAEAEAERIARERERLEAERAEMDRRREEQRQFELELAERQARIDAQMKLEERRLALEARAAISETSVRPSTSPWIWTALAVVAVALAGMQWMQWQVQQDLDASLDGLRAELDKSSFIPVDVVLEPPPQPSPARGGGRGRGRYVAELVSCSTAPDSLWGRVELGFPPREEGWRERWPTVGVTLWLPSETANIDNLSKGCPQGYPSSFSR